MKQIRRFRRTTLIMIWLSCALAGLWLARILPLLAVGWVMIVIILMLIVAMKRTAMTLLAVVVCGIALGWWRGGVFMQQLQPYKEFSGKKVVFVARVQSDTTYSYQGQLSFDVDNIVFVSPEAIQVPGRIGVKGFGEQAVFRGDYVQVEGTLASARGSRLARVSFSQFTIIRKNNSRIEAIRREFIAGVTTALPEPAASFGLGILLGYRTNLSEATSDQLAITGLTHIIAVSGYNLTILVRATRRLLRNRSKYQQTVVCVVLIVTFLLVTDFSASIVRASIVSGLSLAAWYYGRQFKPLLILLLTAAITALWNPTYIWSDIGWYLSFLAFFGILIISPLLVHKLYGRRENPPQLSLLLLETTSAQIMTAPLILYIFERASLIGIVSNIVIGPLVPLAMLLTLIAGVAGMLSPVLASWIAFPARVLLRYMLEVIGLFARIPYAAVERSISFIGMLCMYLLIAITIIIMRKSVVQKYGKITDKETII